MKVLVPWLLLVVLWVSAVSAGCKDYCDSYMCTDYKKGCDKGYYPRESCHCSSLKKPKQYCCVKYKKVYPIDG
uniref:Uncharacterized protein n=1 Tax=Sphaerodactylus townsendi TaxID=933632 RepID=A0ACB8G9E1_9SAUR